MRRRSNEFVAPLPVNEIALLLALQRADFRCLREGGERMAAGVMAVGREEGTRSMFDRRLSKVKKSHLRSHRFSTWLGRNHIEAPPSFIPSIAHAKFQAYIRYAHKYVDVSFLFLDLVSFLSSSFRNINTA